LSRFKDDCDHFPDRVEEAEGTVVKMEVVLKTIQKFGKENKNRALLYGGRDRGQLHPKVNPLV